MTVLVCLLLAGYPEGEDAENEEGNDLEEADGEADNDGEETPNAGEDETNESG